MSHDTKRYGLVASVPVARASVYALGAGNRFTTPNILMNIERETVRGQIAIGESLFQNLINCLATTAPRHKDRSKIMLYLAVLRGFAPWRRINNPPKQF